MRTTHKIHVEIALQNFRVATLDARRHRISDVRVQLVPVQSENLQAPAIQEKSIDGEARFAEADPHAVIVQRAFVHEQRRDDMIKVW